MTNISGTASEDVFTEPETSSRADLPIQAHKTLPDSLLKSCSAAPLDRRPEKRKAPLPQSQAQAIRSRQTDQSRHTAQERSEVFLSNRFEDLAWELRPSIRPANAHPTLQPSLPARARQIITCTRTPGSCCASVMVPGVELGLEVLMDEQDIHGCAISRRLPPAPAPCPAGPWPTVAVPGRPRATGRRSRDRPRRCSARVPGCSSRWSCRGSRPSR